MEAFTDLDAESYLKNHPFRCPGGTDTNLALHSCDEQLGPSPDSLLFIFSHPPLHLLVADWCHWYDICFSVSRISDGGYRLRYILLSVGESENRSVVDGEGRRSQGGKRVYIDRMRIFPSYSICTGTEGLYSQYRRFSNNLSSRKSFQTLAHTGEFIAPFRLAL